MSSPTDRLKTLIKAVAVGAAAAVGPQRWPVGAARLWILMYHRVLPADDPRYALEEPGMLVTPATFDSHITTLKRHFEIVALPDWVQRRREGRTLPRRACAITFDDGWADNYEFAFPALQRHGVPATIFLVTDMVGTNRRFWPNRLAQLLSAAGPRWRTLEPLDWLAQRVDQTPAAATFREHLARCIDIAKSMPEPQLLALIERSEQALTGGDPAAADLMSWQQVHALAETGLVTFGSHTRNHVRLLPSVSADVIESEVVGSQQSLADRLDTPVELFCYPNGDASEVATRAVASHYAAAVTTRRGINAATTPLALLRRIGLHEDVSATPRQLLARLSGWV